MHQIYTFLFWKKLYSIEKLTPDLLITLGLREKNGKYTLLKRDGSLLGTWFDSFYEQYGHSLCSVGGQEYLIDRDTLKLKPYTKEQKRQDKEFYDELRYEKSHYY